MRIASWNVNGLRACSKKGFGDWLSGAGADIVGVQEVRANEEQIPNEVRNPEGFATHFVAAERPGYSGVGLFSRETPDEIETKLGVEEFDAEGRLQIARFGKLQVVNCYFPNGNGKERDNSRVPFKLDFYRALFDRLEKGLRDGEPILVMGDFNTAHRPVDLARPKQNEDTSGFLPEERDELDRWLRNGFVDTFRHFHPEAKDRYSWWSQRFNVRAKNIGWRIDYVLASPGAMPYVKAADILHDVMGSDHCPVVVDVAPDACR
ncbi:exodeoxyribonuclease III [Vulgatibacter incomptus]|uniref:Exodeoxyribonuclease III n=1 Tax=Vulgatibacter incomptus TaxID=1391653 RepID=A0A0K1PD77_9BACT|nr:exodeoxyribonuclease III [Vulgatibacter incomptus]AKU91498.1 Exodeoxyribonuclease III [Vulgatibacter incomptus]